MTTDELPVASLSIDLVFRKQVENWFINVRMREWRPAMRRALDHAEVRVQLGPSGGFGGAQFDSSGCLAVVVVALKDADFVLQRA